MRVKIGIIGFSKSIETLISHIFENINYIKYKHSFSIQITFYFNGLNYFINDKGLSPDELLETMSEASMSDEEDITFIREINNLAERIKESKAQIIVLSLPKFLKKQNYKYIKTLLSNNINVITTVKDGIAENIDELEDISNFNNLFFSFLPALNIITPLGDFMEQISSHFEIHGFEGILNRFSNIIISEMIKNKSSVMDEYEFLKEVYPEHEELISEDLDGYSSAVTAFLLAHKYMTNKIDFKDVKIMGIKNLKYEKIKKIIEDGNSVKFLGKAAYEDEKLKIRITPSIISRSHSFYGIDDMSEAMLIFSDFPTYTLFSSKGTDNFEKDMAYSIFREIIKFGINLTRIYS